MVRKLKNSTSSNSGQVDIIKKAKQMQEAMLVVQDGLKDKFVETSVAGGQVVVKANGQKQIINIKISNEVVEEAVKEKSTEELEQLVLTAVSDALVKADELAEKEMEAITGGVQIPGLF